MLKAEGPVDKRWRETYVVSMKVEGFLWDDDNVEHIARHDVYPFEVEEVFEARNYTYRVKGKRGDERFVALGQTLDGRYLTVVWALRERLVYVITARDSTQSERRLLQKRGKGRR